MSRKATGKTISSGTGSPGMKENQFKVATTPDGTIRNANGSIAGLRGTLQNDKERMRAGDTLLETRDLLSAILNNTHVLIACLDREFNFIVVNEIYARADGREPDFYVGKNHFMLFPSADNEAIFRRVVETGEPYFTWAKPFEYAEHPERGKSHWDWSLKPVRDASGQVSMLVLTLLDVTSRVQAEEARRESEERLKKVLEELAATHRQVQDIIDNTPAIVYAFDLEERFVLVNAALAKLLNSTPEKMAGKKRYEYMPQEDADRHEANDRRVINEGKILVFEEYSNLKDRFITWYTTKFPLYDGQGKIYAVAGISADISERKRFEGELKKYNETLEESVRSRTEELKKQQEHLEELNQNLLRTNKELENFAYIASHDLQEPLRMVTSFTQLLSLKYKDQLDDNAKEYIRFAVDGAKRMYELINGLLAYSRINSKEVTFMEVDMNSVIGEVKANLEMIIRERNCLIESGNLPLVFANKNQMIQLFQNLIANAIKFSPDQPHIVISSKNDKTHFHFSVKDGGIGIEPEYFDKIFEIFKRLMPKDQYEGTGLGLAICKRIVENHNGTIWVESEPGNGSVFHFTLPRFNITFAVGE